MDTPGRLLMGPVRYRDFYRVGWGLGALVGVTFGLGFGVRIFQGDC